MSIRNIFVTALLLLGTHATFASDETTNTVQHELDVLANEVIESLINAELPLAQTQATKLVEHYPNSKLGQLLFAETQALASLQDSQLTKPELMDKQLLDLLLEARIRMNAPTPNNTDIPHSVIQAGITTKHIVLVDLAASVLWLLDTQGSEPVIKSQHYISGGAGGFHKFEEGDLKTPLGVYHINGARSDESLPRLYGSGALMLNYPNDFDRANARGGSGIWLHGVPREEWNRPPLSSEGCVTMANDLFNTLANTVDPASTQVIFDSNISWHKPSDLHRNRKDMVALFQRFQNAWQHRHVQALEAIYSDSMQAQFKPSIASPWKRVANKTTASELVFNPEQTQALTAVEPNQISILRHRSLSADFKDQEITVMSFELGPSRLQVALYWAKDPQDQWRIIFQAITPASV